MRGCDDHLMTLPRTITAYLSDNDLLSFLNHLLKIKKILARFVEVSHVTLNMFYMFYACSNTFVIYTMSLNRSCIKIHLYVCFWLAGA